MKRLSLFTILLTATLMPLRPAYPAEPVTVRPESAGMSTERLERIVPSMRAFIDDGIAPGCVTLVARKGGIVHIEAYGFADRESKRPMAPDTIFRIASMTKPITAVAALILYEEGAFLLSDPLSKYIPEFTDMTVLVPVDRSGNDNKPYVIVSAEKTLTVSHIFNHTSGITYGGGLLSEFYRKEGIGSGLSVTGGTIGEMVKRLAKQPLAHQPGEDWSYGLSNDVLGYFIEVVSGMPFDRFAEERIFKPLGMKDTYFSVPGDKESRIATLYTVGKDGALIRQTDEESAAIRMSQKTYFSGGGGLYSTAPDYFRFAQMLLNGGEYNGVRILSPKTVELMTSDSTGGIDILQGSGHTLATHGDRYGLGIGIRAYRGDIESIGSYGWGGAFNTLFWVDPDEELIGIIMSQVGSQPDKTMHRVFRIVAYAAMTE